VCRITWIIPSGNSTRWGLIEDGQLRCWCVALDEEVPKAQLPTTPPPTGPAAPRAKAPPPKTPPPTGTAAPRATAGAASATVITLDSDDESPSPSRTAAPLAKRQRWHAREQRPNLSQQAADLAKALEMPSPAPSLVAVAAEACPALGLPTSGSLVEQLNACWDLVFAK
jgi:hypothetical protein